MDNNPPKYLYHYTNINTLALILKNRTIRFSSLDNVDDLEESKTNDLGNFGKYCYISCWTENDEESIPFWHMYTENNRGVRIKLPSNPFKKYLIPKGGSTKEDIDTYFDPVTYYNNNYIISPPLNDILKKVNYTDDSALIYPKVFTQDNNTTTFETTNIGRCKRNYWSFQQEWRYLFIIYPLSFKELSSNSPLIINKLLSRPDLPMNHYYLKLDDKAFTDMEITLGPNTTDGDKIIVESLISQYNPNAKLIESSLKGKIRV